MDKTKVYIVTYVTWNALKIEKVFSNAIVAQKYADAKEKERQESGNSDGYNAYYVHVYNLETTL